MSNHKNHRRGEERRTENGPSWESANPGKGCNSTHVARARKKWKRFKNRTLRRNGKVSHKYHWMVKGRKKAIFYDDVSDADWNGS